MRDFLLTAGEFVGMLVIVASIKVIAIAMAPVPA